MSITKKPARIAEAAASAFIAGAPDAQRPEPKTIKQSGRKAIITVSIDPRVLADLDAWAAERGLSRAAAISLAVSQLRNPAGYLP